MPSALWANESQGNSADWSRNQALEDLINDATLYDDANTDYDSITVYYDGYNPTGQTPEGESPAAWSDAAQGSTAPWEKVAE